MHHLCRTNYRVDRAGLNTERTANAFRLYDESELGGMRWTAFRIEWDRRLIEQCGEPLDRDIPTWGAAVDGGF